MERKTMGSFIAALRKANGLTQKELAEKLNVSDKAVSRWERDENAPDLSLIPVIAEIFGVTADELLRGERAAPADENPVRSAEKAERQIRRLVSSVLTDFRIRSILSAGLSLAGLIAAMIFNFGLTWAYMGFFAACLFFVAAAGCEAVFLIRAFAAVRDSFEGEAIDRCKKSLISTAEWSFSLILILFSAVLPLILLPPYNYVGLPYESWQNVIVPAVAVTALLCLIVCLLLNFVFVKRGVYTPSREKRLAAKRRAVHALITLLVLGLSFALHQMLTSSVLLYAEGTVFQDTEEFIAYMEQPKANPEGNTYTDLTGIFYDEDGNPISRREFLTKHIYNGAGEEVLSYLNLNWEVSSVGINWEGNQILDITVHTYEEVAAAESVFRLVNIGFCALYAIELIVSLLLYFRKKKT